MEKIYNYIKGKSPGKILQQQTDQNPNNKVIDSPITKEKKLMINKVKNRILHLSPTVREGLERECNKDDFFSEGDRAIGKGAFGQVWKVRHKKTDKVYVIKVMNKQNIIEQKMGEHINLEVEILYKINHPHIIKLYNHYEDDDNIYLIMQYALKGQLYSHLKKQNRLDQRTVAQYLRELISALKHLHSFDPPIIHRDIKPENILLDESGRIKLADFGWSNYEDYNKRTTYCGTPEYLAPEMIKKEGHDTMVDIWTIGVLMFELLVGKPPYSGNGQVELLANIKKNKISWPDDFPPLAKNLLILILKINPKERIGLDEILKHYWFEKNPPLRPVLTETSIDPKMLLESFLINKTPENVKEEINKISYLMQQKRKSILDQNKDNNIEKIKLLQNQNPSNQNKNSKNNGTQELDNDIQDFKSIKNNINIDDQLSGVNLNVTEILEKNEILKKEIIEIKIRYDKFDNENKSLKMENAKLKEKLSKETISNENETKILNEELNKLKIINMDRLDILGQIEEKNNIILEIKRKLDFLENEKETDKINLEKYSNKIIELEEIIKNENDKYNEISLKFEELQKQKTDLLHESQTKIDNLQNKLFDFNYFQNEENSNGGSSLGGNNNGENENNSGKILEMIYGNIKDFENTFKKGIENMEKRLFEVNENSAKSDKKILEIIEERHSNALEIFRKMNNSTMEEMQKYQNKDEEDSSNKKINERIEWMKKQINELMNYKVKFTNLEIAMKKIENQNKKLEEECELYMYNCENLKKIDIEKNEKIAKNENYIRNLEARLSDVKDFMFKFHSDKIEDLFKWYKF
jgi:serine/threonine protein kinase